MLANQRLLDPSASSTLLQVVNLTVRYKSGNGDSSQAVTGISFELARGEALGILGESGSGKSSLALAVVRLLSPNADLRADALNFDGHDLLALSEKMLRRIRGAKLSFIAQEAGLALNPLMRVGAQITDVVHAHSDQPNRTCRERAWAALDQVCSPDTDRIFDSYPHQLSGGQKQRVLIAQAIANSPTLLIADEPTSSLDATLQTEVLDLIANIQTRTGMALIVISHNPAVINRLASRVMVMCGGEAVEDGEVESIFTLPQHPFTKRLLRVAHERYA